MKKGVLCILLFSIAFPLFAQQTNRNILMYVPSVTGTGSTDQDNIIFIDFIVRELWAWGFTLVDTPEQADYAIPGMLGMDPSIGHTFTLALQNRNGIRMYEQILYYQTPEEARGYIPAMVSSLLSHFTRFAEATQNALMYVTSVSGTGSTPEDNTTFVSVITRELLAWNIALKEKPEEADYIVLSVLVPSETGYLLEMVLRHKDGTTLYDQALHYQTREKAILYIPSMVLNMLSPVFPPKKEDEKKIEKIGFLP
ncbi:MAG: hypothetical protein FWD36_04940, partial [Treponema sp.]|nr:hypothetical protein [Treponema sp.]